MKEIISIIGTNSDALDQHIRDRLTHALNQHEGKVISVQVRLADINGPRGGEDKQIRVLIRLQESADVVIEDTGEDAYAIASIVADRAKQTVGRHLAKAKER